MPFFFFFSSLQSNIDEKIRVGDIFKYDIMKRKCPMVVGPTIKADLFF